MIDIVVLGSKNVGKKTMVKSKFFDSPGDSEFMAMIGVAFPIKNIEIYETKVKLRFRIFTHEQRFWGKNQKVNLEIQVRRKHGAIVIYDITNSETLEQASHWIQIVKDNTEGIPIFLVGNKLDLEEQREVSKEQAEKIKNKHNLASVMEISVKSEENMEKMISELAYMIINHIREISELDEKRDSFVRSINSAIWTEKMKLEGKNRLKKQRKIWRKHYAEGTETFEDFLKKQKERIIKFEEMRNSLINAKELADLLKVWKKAKILLNI